MALRVLRNTQRAITVTFYSGSTPVDATGAVTVDITRGDGSSFATGQATVHGASNSGQYTYTLAPQANLDRLTFDFSGTFGGAVQHASPVIVEVVGNVYVPLAELKAMDGMSSFSDDTVTDTRSAVEDLFERYIGNAYVPRYAHEWAWGDDTTTLWLSSTPVRRLLSVKVNAISTSFSTWTVQDTGQVLRDSGTFPSSYRVETTYEYGYDEPDAELRLAAARLVRRLVIGTRSGIPDNAISMTTSEGGFQLSIAGEQRPTGDPFIDGVLMRHRGTAPAGAPLVG